RFRSRTNEERLKQNLQLLSASSSGGEKGPRQSAASRREEFGGKRPSGVGYFRRLWPRLLAKCKIEQIDQLRNELIESGGSVASGQQFLEAPNWAQFVHRFRQFELNFAKRLALEIDRQLAAEPEGDFEASLQLNQTPTR